ncbi:DUF3247 family protein [Rhodanobacter sp. 7MK24]|uniref:DUF3247 family protein n=1 Tax=Rhodanobacter sp. 7MK24 TaxID=2775922 RepID=UPI0017801F9E|nr:DUF3247 family protein [Rhodanobacter sp. 7MK24]MBD8881399.1 DUF3247 family protein [Rhodanobacter sp. 7MK24]
MGRSARHVYSDPAAVAALQAIASKLSANGHVRLTLKDGGICEGVIAERASAQVYFDPAEQHLGIDGGLWLERPDEPGWHCWMWLDEIASVEHLDFHAGQRKPSGFACYVRNWVKPSGLQFSLPTPWCTKNRPSGSYLRFAAARRG